MEESRNGKMEYWNNGMMGREEWDALM